MTARDALDGMKARLAYPVENLNFVQQAAAENHLLKVDMPRLIGAVEAVLSECDYLDTLAPGDKHYAAGFRKLIENALNP